MRAGFTIGARVLDRVLLTGAGGFIGRAMQEALLGRGHPVRAVVRHGSAVGANEYIDVPKRARSELLRLDIAPTTSWAEALLDCRSVVHLAALAHVPLGRMDDALAACRAINTVATLNLARQAASVGVRRFVFASTIKVNGESTRPGRPFTISAAPAPQEAYAISKMEAEIGLRKIADETGMEVVIVRPPLVYGPGVKGNFAELMRWVARGIPLPLAGIENRRSLVALDNLVDLLLRCVEHPGAANQTFLVSDGEDLSTTDLLRRLAAAMGRPSRLFPLPQSWLRGAAALIGRGDAVARLCDSLQVDMTATREALGWSPPIGVDEGLRRAARENGGA